MPGGVADKGARHRQIQASHPALAISIHSTGHWDREDPITGLANRLRQARVLPSEQQHVSLQELKGAEAVSTVPAAANQAVRARNLYQKIGEVWMDRELNMGPGIQPARFRVRSLIVKPSGSIKANGNWKAAQVRAMLPVLGGILGSNSTTRSGASGTGRLKESSD